MIRQLAIAISLALMSLAASGATYYVDYVGGNDAANGTSTNTAWKRCPGDSNATGVAGAVNLVAGDTVMFKGGSNYVGTIRLNWSGNTANRITYDGTSWNGTRARHTTAFAPNTSAWETGTGNNRSNVTVHGFEIFQVGGRAYNDAAYNGVSNSITSWPTGNAFWFDASPVNFVISNNVMREIGSWTNTIENRAVNSVAGNGVQIRRGGTNNLVVSNILYKVPIGLGIHATATTRALSNVFHGNTISNHIRWMIEWSGDANGAAFVANRITGNKLGDANEYDQVNWKPDNCQCNPSGHPDGPFDSPHCNQIIVRCNGLQNQTWTNNVIAGNRFWTDTSLAGGGTAGIFNTQGASLDIFNNVFVNLRQPYSISISHFNTLTNQQVVRIYNNTFWNGNIRDGTETSATKRRVYIKGNAFYTTSDKRPLTIEQNYLKLAELDGNVYYTTLGSQPTWNVAWLEGYDTSSKFADLRSAGFETTGVFGNPAFLGSSSPWRDVILSVTNGSACIGAGVNLTNIVTTDYNNVSRVGQTRTIGAYVFGEVVAGDTNAPTPNPLTWVTEPEVVGEGAIFMSWSTATDDSGVPVTYTVFETTGNPGCTGPFSTTGTNYTDSLIPEDTTCSYQVQACDQTGNCTTLSSEQSATTPVQPAQFAATVVRATVNLLISGERAATNLFYLNAEGAGTQSGWTDIGSATEWDRNDVVYAGTNVFNAGDTTNFSYTITPTFNTSSNLTVVGQVWRNSVSGTPRKIWDLLLDGVVQASGYYSTNGLMIEHGTVTNTVPLYSPQQNWYSYRVIYAPDTGETNGLLQAWWGTSMAFSQSATNQITTGTSTGAVNSVMFGHTNGLPGNRFYYDETWARAGTNSIPGDNPNP